MFAPDPATARQLRHDGCLEGDPFVESHLQMYAEPCGFEAR